EAPPGREGRFFGYVALIGVLALVLTAPYLAGLPGFLRSAPVAFWLMAALAVLCDAVPFPASGRRASPPVLPSVCFGFAALLCWGVGAAVVVASAAVAASS